MRLKVFRPKKEEEKVLNLALYESVRGITLRIVGENGEPIDGGFLLAITNDLRIERFCSIDEQFGIPTDERGRMFID